jgi:hypothetical protein
MKGPAMQGRERKAQATNGARHDPRVMAGRDDPCVMAERDDPCVMTGLGPATHDFYGRGE